MMKLPAAFFLRILPVHSSQAAAIALCAVYGVLSTFCYGMFAVWRYPPYLSAALGAGGKFLGFLLRSIFLSNFDMNVYAAATVFLTAGMSACTSALAAVLSDWFKNASAAQRLGFHQRYPRVLPAICRLMSIPVLVFGPGIGVPAAILMYGARTPESVKEAMRIRKWSAWGTLACLIVLTVLALLATVLALMRRDSRRPSLFLMPSVLLCIVLTEVSGAARVRAIYQPSVSTNDHLWYTLIVLPELLQQLITAIPTLMLRAGYANQYTGWRTGTWGWVRRAFPPAAAVDALVEKGTAASAHLADDGAGSCACSQDDSDQATPDSSTCTSR